MGGDYIPSSFVKAPDSLWERLTTIIRTDDWYRFVGITRRDLGTLLLRDGDERRTVPINDEIIEVFHQLQNHGPKSALVFDRLFNQCWLTTWEECEPFLDYSMSIDDES
ncbi:MAG: hypothetical protein QM754_07100 [Tepidisphaeraceae bacterium]